MAGAPQVNIRSTKVLTTKQEIMDYLRISEILFRKFIDLGMPAVSADNRWYAHADNIDDWFKKMTVKGNMRGKKLSETVLDAG